MDRDFSAEDALKPILKLLLGPDGEELRVLVIKESIRVTEAFMLGSMIDGYNSIPGPLKNLIVNNNTVGPSSMSTSEQEALMDLREQVSRIWKVLQSLENFDPNVLQPILLVLQESKARSLGGRVFGGITQRLSTRFLRQLLRSPTVLPAPSTKCDVIEDDKGVTDDCKWVEIFEDVRVVVFCVALNDYE